MPRQPTKEDPKFEALRQAIDNAVIVRGYIDYRKVGTYESRIQDLLPDLEDFIDEGRIDDAVTLIERTMQRMEENWDNVDDNDGNMGDIFKELQVLHHKAVKASRAPIPKYFAHYLFTKAMASTCGAFWDAPQTYADILGEEGIKELWGYIAEAFAKVPIARADADTWKTLHSDQAIKALAKSLAEQINDFEWYLNVYTRELRGSHDYLVLAKICRKCGRDDFAETWAIDGMKMVFQGGVDPRLKSFLADLYADQGKIDAAFKLLWDNFKHRQPVYDQPYKDLKAVGEKVGFWTEWRELVLADLRAREGYDVLRVLISEGLLRKAFEEATIRGGNKEIWELLARELGKNDPDLAYKSHEMLYNFAVIDIGTNGGRFDATHAVAEMRDMAKRLGTESEFLLWIEGEKKRWKRKKRYMATLQRMGL